MTIFVNDFFESTLARTVICMQVDANVLYRGAEKNQFPPAYSSLYWFNFLSFYTSSSVIFVTDFTTTLKGRMAYCIVVLQTSLCFL